MLTGSYQFETLSFRVARSDLNTDMSTESHRLMIRHHPDSLQSEPVYLGRLNITTEPTVSNSNVRLTWELWLDHTPTGDSIETYYAKDERWIPNDEENFKHVLKDISTGIYKHYKDIIPTPQVPQSHSEQETEMKEPQKESVNVQERIKITNILYDLSGVPTQGPAPLYELEVDLRDMNQFPFIKTAQLFVYVQYEVSTQRFHAKISTNRINGVPIQDLNLDDSGYMELRSIYMRDNLKQIDFTEVVCKHLRQVNSRLELCHKILNSNLDQ